MGRHSTGAVTTREVRRLELSFLLRQGYLKNSFSMGGLSWTDGSTMQISSSFNDDERYIKLTYSFRAGGNDEPIQIDYKIYLTSVPSNLGRGEVPYFVCPSTGRRARVLYMCYGSPIFKSRKAYSYRIYYQCQQSSRLNYHNDRYWDLDKELKLCYKRRKKKHYQGKPTRLMTKIQNLEEQKVHHDWTRWEHLPKCLTKKIFRESII
jgi:hypothetical protein